MQGQQINGMNNPGDQNQQMYANLLQTQCLGSDFYVNENYYDNLSYMDLSVSQNDMGYSGSAQPVGIMS